MCLAHAARTPDRRASACLVGLLAVAIAIFYVRPAHVQRDDGGLRTDWHVLLHVIALMAAACC